MKEKSAGVWVRQQKLAKRGSDMFRARIVGLGEREMFKAAEIRMPFDSKKVAEYLIENMKDTTILWVMINFIDWMKVFRNEEGISYIPDIEHEDYPKYLEDLRKHNICKDCDREQCDDCNVGQGHCFCCVPTPPLKRTFVGGLLDTEYKERYLNTEASGVCSIINIHPDSHNTLAGAVILVSKYYKSGEVAIMTEFPEVTEEN